MNSTELWFIREMMENGNYKQSQVGISIQDPKFGYHECYLDIDGNVRYLVKYKQWAGGMRPAPEYENVVFYIQKFKRPLDK